MKRLFLLDGNYLIYRSYHAMSQANMRDSSGQPTGAVYGLLRTLLTLFRDFEPDYVVCAMDSEGPTFRHEFYEEYKIQRPEMPEELRAQLPTIERLLECLEIPVAQVEGFESDDLLASMVETWEDRGDLEILIVSNDKDNFQLVDGSVSILKQKQGLSEVTTLDSGGVEEEMGVPPEQIPDYLSLVGDSVDNIPGVEGIGPTYAGRLLDRFDSVEEMLDHPDEIEEAVSERLAEAVRESAEQIADSKKLVVLRRDAPVEVDLEDARFEGLREVPLIEFCRDLNFQSIREELEERLDETPGWDELQPEWERVPFEEFDPEDPLLDSSELTGWCLGIDPEAKPMEQDCFLLGLSAGDEHRIIELDPDGDYGSQYADLLNRLRDGRLRTFNQKLLQILAYRLGVQPPSPLAEFDLQLASYLVDADRDHTLPEILSRVVKTTVPDRGGASREELCQWMARVSTLIDRASLELDQQLDETDQGPILKELELPLTRLLARMEYNGIAVDTDHLQSLSDEIEGTLEDLRDRAQELAGHSFNLNSPKQLREVLFEELELPVQGKTGSGKPSTDADTLETLQEEHELPAVILEYRRFNKVESTYLKPLRESLNSRTGLLHTEFNQTVAATGRLSSSNPNLQNIPVREEFGRRVREAFVPSRPDYELLGADYSQIELRLLAHMSQDENLVESFREGVDVHTRTASELFDVGEDEVEEDDRRVAKIVNYGIAYGLSAYGLANDLDISEEEAQNYIDRYFERYPGVRAYLDQTVNHARDRGFVETLRGRRRYIPELTSSDYYQRQFAERAAVNAPIQGTAADLMKQAMIDLEPRLEDPPCNLLLQVHDELVLEGDSSRMEELSRLVRDTMSNAIDLRVPVTVSIKVGSNWGEISK